VIDATCPFGFGGLLPRGLLREPISGLRRADLVILTRCDAVEESKIDAIESTIREHHSSVPIMRSRHEPKTLLEHPHLESSIQQLSTKRVATICAIGNPAAFEETVRSCGATIVGSRQLPDHDSYSPETVRELREWIQSIGNDIDQVVCTHKDLVKLQTDRLGGKPLAAILIDLTIESRSKELDHLMNGILDLARQEQSFGE
jgi:tetraacyldisaccharide 4'-kinase